MQHNVSVITEKIQEAKEHQRLAALGELPLTNTLVTCSMLIEVVESQQKRIKQLEQRLQALTNRQNYYDFEGV